VKWLELLTVYVCTTSFIRTPDQLRILTAALVSAGVSQALLGYAQFAFQLGPQAFAHGAFLRAYGSFDQPNPYAGYLNMILPLAVTLSLLSSSRRARFWYACGAILIVGGLMVSQSRGALLATVTALTIVLACALPRIRSWALAAGFALLTGSWLAVLGLVPLGPFERILTAVGLGQVSFGNVTDANFSAVERAAHWLAGVRMFAAHPLLGVGIGNYAVAYPSFHPRGWYAALAHAHNYYINVAAEAGIVGFAAYVLLAGSALWYSYATIGRARRPLCRAVVLGVFGALVATDFHNLFDVLYVHGMVALLGLLMAFVPVSLELGRICDGVSRQPEMTV
jgi:O-antigen ligase